MNFRPASPLFMQTELPGRVDSGWGTPVWDMVVLPRLKKPPLRFRGRCLRRHQSDGCAEEGAFICLWQKQKGGFVVAHSVMTDSGPDTDAQAVDTGRAAMAYLEGYCQSLQPLQVRHLGDFASDTLPVVDLVTLIARRSALDQKFLVLAGNALACWDVLADGLPEPACQSEK